MGRLEPSSPLAGPLPTTPPSCRPEEDAWLATAATAAAAELWAAATAAAAALALTDGGKMGLQGEWELPEALEEAASCTPEDEYRS